MATADRRERLLDTIGESDSCNDDECGCHRAAWDARDELEELDSPLDTRAADALAILSDSLL